MSEVLGGLKVNKLIWLSTCLTLGALFICWNNCDKTDPSIMDTAMEYPYTIIFRVGMMYSLFIYFLVFLFIKWWIDSSQFATMTKPIPILATLGLLSYALFVACIDRARINYPLAKTGVFFSSIFISLSIHLIMRQLRKIRQQTPLFIGQTSWNLKRITFLLHELGMLLGVLIFLGQLDINHKNKVEYLVVISTILFMWTFVYDFKRFKMDIDRIPKAIPTRAVVQQQHNQQQFLKQKRQQYQQFYLGNPQYQQQQRGYVNSFDSIEMVQGSSRF